MLNRHGRIQFGNCNNVQFEFDISHLPNVDMDCLDIKVCSGDNQDFYCTLTAHAVTSKVIDELCHQLNSLKGKLKHNGVTSGD